MITLDTFSAEYLKAKMMATNKTPAEQPGFGTSSNSKL
jgi:hypothetical protein